MPFLIVSGIPSGCSSCSFRASACSPGRWRPFTAACSIWSTIARDRATPVSVNRDEVPTRREHRWHVGAPRWPSNDQDERKLLKSIVDFSDTLVREVMTPRPDIVRDPAVQTLDAICALFREQEYSRIPVFQDSLDNILGFVLREGFHPDRGRRARRPADFGPAAPGALRCRKPNPVTDLLREFQGKRIQSAIVVDEYGGTAGLVTLEDLIEELVGEIRDEYDIEAEPVVEEHNGSFVFSATVDIDEIVDRLKVPIEREGFETVGGYLLSRLGRVPAVGESFRSGRG